MTGMGEKTNSSRQELARKLIVQTYLLNINIFKIVKIAFYVI